MYRERERERERKKCNQLTIGGAIVGGFCLLMGGGARDVAIWAGCIVDGPPNKPFKLADFAAIPPSGLGGGSVDF
jgi:hypothetical protein